MTLLLPVFVALFIVQISASYSPIGLPVRRADSEDDGSGITPLTLSSDGQSYYAVLKTGDISFRVALDTASSDLWILSSQCTTADCKAVPRYPLAYESSTFVSVNGNLTDFSVGYADGTSASGFVAKETVSLANMTIPNQVLGIITDSDLPLVDENSGVLGLGFPRLSSISVTNSTPFFVSLAQQGRLDYPLFALSLTRNSSGSLSIGAIDASVVTNVTRIGWNEVVEFAPFGVESNVSSYLHWAIPLAGLSVNGTQLAPLPTYPNVTNNASIALVDVGTPGIYGPYQDVSRIFSLISGSRLVDTGGQWAIPCDTVVPISFVFGSQNFTLYPTDYLIGPASGNPNLCLSWPRASLPSSDGIDWQIGTAFLRTVYSIFSYGINSKEAPHIGFYALHNVTNYSESPSDISSFFESISTTVLTTLPNFPLSLPTYTTPPYALNSSVKVATGGVVSTGLATSTYNPIFATATTNLTALPTIMPSPTLQTFIITDASGALTTSTSTAAEESVTLGVPPGWTDAASPRCVPILVLAVSLALSIAVML